MIELALNHEQQHQELMLADIKHVLWSNPQRPAYHPQVPEMHVAGPALDWVEVDEELVQGDAQAHAVFSAGEAVGGSSSCLHFWHCQYVPFFFEFFSERNAKPHAGHGWPATGRSHAA